MFCEKCGEVLIENSKFCGKCGNPVVMMQENPIGQVGFSMQEPSIMPEVDAVVSNVTNSKKPKKKMKKWKRTLIIIGLIILVIIVSGLGIYFTSATFKIQKALGKDNAMEVVQLYNGSIYGKLIQEPIANSLIKDYMKDMVDAYKENPKDYEQTYETISTLMQLANKDLMDTAKEYLDEIVIHFGDYETYELAEELYASGEYEAAIKKYETIAKESDYYENAQEKKDECASDFKEYVLDEVTSPQSLEEYETALTLLAVAIETIEDNEELMEKETELTAEYLVLVKETALEDATKAVTEEDYASAMEDLSWAIEKLPDDTELNSMLTTVVTTYESGIIGLVDTYVAEKNYNQAIKTLNAALTVLPNSSVLSTKLQQVEDAKPISLTTLTAINGGFDWNIGQPIDSFGNTYNTATNYAVIKAPSWEMESYAEYRLYGDYSTFNFSVSPSTELPEEGYGYVQIYVDDKLAFTTNSVTRKTDMQQCSVDVTNAEYIKIVVMASNEDVSYKKGCLLLLNATLEK